MSRLVLSSELDRALRADALMARLLLDTVSTRLSQAREDFGASARAAALNPANAPRAAYTLGRLSVLEELERDLASLGA
ncbi:MAG: hypothetical protein IKE76_11990 [Clostridia bacterium]|nr:hypothetical protein [Clostridia bacterium]